MSTKKLHLNTFFFIHETIVDLIGNKLELIGTDDLRKDTNGSIICTMALEPGLHGEKKLSFRFICETTLLFILIPNL